MPIIELNQFDIDLASPINFATGAFWSGLDRIAKPASARLLLISDILRPEDVVDGFDQIAPEQRDLSPAVRLYRQQYVDHLGEKTAAETRFIRTYLIIQSHLDDQGLVDLLDTYNIPANVVDDIVPQPFANAQNSWKAAITDDGMYWGLLRSKSQQVGFIYPRGLHRLYGLEFPVYISIDLHTYSTQEALNIMHLKGVAAKYDRNQTNGGAEAQDVISAIGSLQQEMNRYGSKLHTIQLHVLCGGNSQSQLRQRVEIVNGSLPLVMESVPIEDAPGVFSAEAPREVNGAVLSTPGVSLLTGSALSYRRRTETKGILLGTDKNQSPIILNLFDDRHPSYNMVVLGQTGSGKTFAVLVLLMRHLLLGAQGVIIDPQGNIDLSFLGDEYHKSVLGVEGNSINILDPVRGELMDQVAGVKNSLRMLGTADIGDGLADAILDEVLMDIYRSLWSVREQVQSWPTLGDVEKRLLAIAGDVKRLPIIQQTAGLIAYRMRPLTQGSAAHLFNRPTTVDFSLDRRVTVYDVSKLPDPRTGGALRAALLAILVGDINQSIRRKRPEDTTPIVFFVDEMGVLMKDPIMANYISQEYKTARSRFVAMIVADQDLPSFLGPADPINSVHYGYPILANAVNNLIFRQKGSELASIRQYFPDVPTNLVDQLPGFGQGTCVAQLPDDLIVAHVQPTPLDKIILSSRLQDRENAKRITQQLATELGI